MTTSGSFMRYDRLKRLFLLVLCAVVLTGCQKTDAPDPKNKAGLEITGLRYLGSPGFVSLPELAADLGYLAPIQLNYLGVATGGPQGIQTVASGDVDISSQAFNGAIIKSIAAGVPVKAVVAGYGTLKDPIAAYYVLNDSTIKTPRDLIGKKVAVNTLGAHMEFILREYLHRNGLSDEEIKQVDLVVIPPGTSEQVLRQKQADAAVLDGPAVDRGGVHLLFNDYDLYGEFTAGSYVMSNQFIQNKPKAAAHIVGAIAKAVEWSRQQPRDVVIARFAKIITQRGRNETADSVKYWRGWGIAGTGGLMADNEFQRWIDWLVKDGQLQKDQVKASDFYTNSLNPYANNATVVLGTFLE